MSTPFSYGQLMPSVTKNFGSAPAEELTAHEYKTLWYAAVADIETLQQRDEKDEALLMQALEVLSRTHQTAMEQAMKARVPECAEFAEIFQDLDFVVAALRERLGGTK